LPASRNPAEMPFTEDGSLLHYPEWWHAGFTWHEAEPFTCTLTLDGARRGRSAAYFMWRDPATGRTFPMFLHSVEELIKAADIIRGTVTGTWLPVKRGQNYGIKLVSVTA